MSQGDLNPTGGEKKQRAKAFVSQLVLKFQIRIDEEGEGAKHPKARFQEEQKLKQEMADLIKPFKARFEAAAKVDAAKLDDERAGEVKTHKQALAKHLADYATLSKQKNVEGAKVEIEKANLAATQLLSRRYRLDKDGDQLDPMEGTPQYEAGDLREFEGKALRPSYRGESKTHYENAEAQAKSADYIDAEGKLRDHLGNLLDSETDGNKLFTSRLDTGTSHRFSDEAGKFKHHSYAAEGKEVIGAGGRIVEKGIVRKITGDSGHYTPSARNIHEYVEGLMEQGAKFVDDESLFMPDPSNPGSHMLVTEQTLLDDWRDVAKYEAGRAEAQKKGETVGKYDPEIAKKKQNLADLEVWPGQKDATIEGVREGLLLTAKQFDAPKDGDKSPQAKANRIFAALRERFGDTLYLNGGEQPLTEKIITSYANTERVEQGMGLAKSLSDLTLEDVNRVIGILLRLRSDIDPDVKTTSKARVELDAQRFVQTGGNAEAISQKADLNKELQAKGAKLTDAETDTRTAKLYADLGGDAKLAAVLKVDDPAEIADVDLKYAWLVKGRISNDRALDAVLLRRFPDDVQPDMVAKIPFDVKLELLGGAAMTDAMRDRLYPPDHYSPPDLIDFGMSCMVMSDIPAIARRLKMKPQEIKDKIAGRELTYLELAGEFNLTTDELFDKLAGSPSGASTTPTGEAIVDSSSSGSSVSDDSDELTLAKSSTTPTKNFIPLESASSSSKSESESGLVKFAGGKFKLPSFSAFGDEPVTAPIREHVAAKVGVTAEQIETWQTDEGVARLLFEDLAKKLKRSLEDVYRALGGDPNASPASSSVSVSSSKSKSKSAEMLVVPPKTDGKVKLPPFDEFDSRSLLPADFPSIAARMTNVTAKDLEALAGKEFITLGDIARKFGLKFEDLYKQLGGDPNAKPDPFAKASSSTSSVTISSSSSSSMPIAKQPDKPGLSKVDLRKINKSTVVDPKLAEYESLGGDDALLENLLALWKKDNVTALAGLQKLEKARNEFKKANAKSPKIDEQLAKFDADQAAERKPLKSALKLSRPSLGDLNDDGIDAATKIGLLSDSAGQRSFLNDLLARNTKRKEEKARLKAGQRS